MWDLTRSVSLSSNGNTVAIGALYNSSGYNNSGYVSIYSLVGSTWQQIGEDIGEEGETPWRSVFIK